MFFRYVVVLDVEFLVGKDPTLFSITMGCNTKVTFGKSNEFSIDILMVENIKKRVFFNLLNAQKAIWTTVNPMMKRHKRCTTTNV